MFKRVFFALCSAIKYDKPEDPKLLVGENLVKLEKRVLRFFAIFKTFTQGLLIPRKDIISACNGLKDEASIKAIELVVSEQIDFARFLTCLPFFLWIKAVHN